MNARLYVQTLLGVMQHCGAVRRAALALISLGFFVSASLAATFVVTNTNDNGPGTLRQAVLDANTNVQADTIAFDPSVFSTPQTILLTTGEIRVLRDDGGQFGLPVSIVGPGATLLTIDGNNQSRIFYSNSGTAFTLSGVTLRRGFAAEGGAIYSSDSIQISKVVITDNLAAGDVVGAETYSGRGGGIYAGGGGTIRDSLISNNIASGILRPSQNPPHADSGSDGRGGGIYGTGQIINCTFTNNLSRGISGSDRVGGFGGEGGNAYGGAIYFSSGNGSIMNSRFFSNRAIAGHGGAVTEGTGGEGGGAQGGAVFTEGANFLNSAFVENSAEGGNGGVSTLSHLSGDGGFAAGGAIYERSSGRMANVSIVQNSIISGNGRVGGNATGGGIRLANGQYNVSNFTITNNSSAGGTGTQTNGVVRGGGVYSAFEETPPTPNFRNNIVADNTCSSGPDVFGFFPGSVNNLIRTGDGSTGIVNGTNGNLVGTAAAPIDPMLGPLGDNGAITQTRALMPGSPAIDAGNNTVMNPLVNPSNPQPLLFDQRNFQRRFPTNGMIDIGAYEFGAPIAPIASTSPDLQSTSDTGDSTSDNITRSTSPRFDVLTAIPGAEVELFRDGVLVASAEAITFTVSITDASPPMDAVVQYTSRQTIGGVTSVSSAPLTVTFDHIGPTGTINQASTQVDPARFTPVVFTAVFSEPVSGPGTISFAGSTANTNTAFTISEPSNGGLTWKVDVHGITANGLTVVAGLTAGAYTDLAGNGGSASTSTDNTVTLDNVRPTVTVNQAAGQPDPTSNQPINYTVAFSEPITGFASTGISFSGSSAGVSQANINIAGGPSVFNVAISNVRTSGVVRVSVFTNAGLDPSGNGNFASTATDNLVTFNRRSRFDYDGDGRADISVFRPDSGAWYLNRSTAGFFGIQFGFGTDKIVPADYDGDGKTDIAVYRPAEGQWYIVNSSSGVAEYRIFGLAEDLPAPADYDGDGKADICVFRPSTGTWYLQRSSNGSFFGIQFGSDGDRPTVGDFDGDGKSDIGIWRPSNGDWYHIRSSDGLIFGERFGISTDKMVPADYDGDGKTDLAVWRPSSGIWYIKQSSTNSYVSFLFGLSTDIPAPGDFDGDGKADRSVFRESDGTWYITNSTNGSFTIFPWGQAGDRPTPGAFLN